MSQGALTIADGDGAAVLAALNAMGLRLATRGSGTSRPSDIQTHEVWIETDNPGAGVVSVWHYDGTSDILLALVNTSAHSIVWYQDGSPVATQAYVAANASGATPRGRLTLATGEPVMSSAQTGKTVVLYTPYTGAECPIYDGSKFVATAFTERSNDLTQSSTGKAGPAAATTNSNYDLFMWDDSGTVRLTRGPAWTSDTARGTGAGTTELQRVLGIWTNKVAITNGPAANRGTYVGTIRTDGSSQCNWNPIPAAASGGGNVRLDVFNAYNRIKVDAQSLDNTASWSYATTTWRSTNNSTSNRISYIDGLGEIYVDATQAAIFSGPTCYVIGINRDSTSATPSRHAQSWAPPTPTTASLAVDAQFLPSLGFHYLQAMEYSTGGGAATQGGTGSGFAAYTGQYQALAAHMFM